MDFVKGSPMFLVYEDEYGVKHFQPWQDLPEMGTLIDSETGEDMELVGWSESDTAV